MKGYVMKHDPRYIVGYVVGFVAGMFRGIIHGYNQAKNGIRI